MPRNTQRPKIYMVEATRLAFRENLRRHEHKLANDPDYAKRDQEAIDKCIVGMRQVAREAEQRQRDIEISFELRHTPIGYRRLI